MSLLAEEIVEEWLNRQGFFTIRGIKQGLDEIDLLAIRVTDGKIERRHIEVQASSRPIGYVTSVSKERQKSTGSKPSTAKKRSTDEILTDVMEWIVKKFSQPKKEQLRQTLCPGKWKYELVVHNVRHPEELEIIAQQGIKVHRLSDVVVQLNAKGHLVPKSAGADLIELVLLGEEALS